MESYYSHSQYKSANFILNSYASDMFDSITLIMRPVVGGIDYLRSVRQGFKFQKELNNFSTWSPQTREKILDALTDVVAENEVVEVKTIYQKVLGELESKLSGLEEANETFTRLNQFSDTLTPEYINIILTLSLNKLNGKITSIRSEINLKMWDKNENVNELLVLDQSFYLIQEMINQSLKIVTSPNGTDYGELWSTIIVSLLYIEAFHRGKVSFEQLQDYVSALNLYCYKEEEPYQKKYDAIFELYA